MDERRSETKSASTMVGRQRKTTKKKNKKKSKEKRVTHRRMRSDECTRGAQTTKRLRKQKETRMFLDLSPHSIGHQIAIRKSNKKYGERGSV
jgi:hypothetical protein